jgi:hypothetical protein
LAGAAGVSNIESLTADDLKRYGRQDDLVLVCGRRDPIAMLVVAALAPSAS